MPLRTAFGRIWTLVYIVVLAIAGMIVSAGAVSADEMGQRPLLLVLVSPDPSNPRGIPLAHPTVWYQARIFGEPVFGGTGVGARNLVDYYSALSRGQFTFREAATIAVTDDTSAEFEEAAGVVPTDSGTDRTRKRVRLLAANAGFDYSEYDTNRDRNVTTDELTILSVDSGSTASGQTGVPPCLNISNVEVCSGVSLTGHQSDLMNYAHELAHLLSPGARDLYGAALPPPQTGKVCNSSRLTLMSCTIDFPSDEVVGFFMDPWHRKRYGWNGFDQQVHLGRTGTGSGLIAPLGSGSAGVVDTLTLQKEGFGNETVTFEYRDSMFNPYEDGLDATGLLAWFQKTDRDGVPVELPTLEGELGGTDAAVFSLAPDGCELNPNRVNSRGKAGALGAGDYRITWTDGTFQQFRVDTALFGYQISWNQSIAVTCAPNPPLLPPLRLPPLAPCITLPQLCNPCGPLGLCLPPASG